MRRTSSTRTGRQLTSKTAEAETKLYARYIEHGIPTTDRARNVTVVGAETSGLVAAWAAPVSALELAPLRRVVQ